MSWLQAQSALGFVTLAALAWLLGERRRPVAWRPVLAGLLLQLILALLLLHAPVSRSLFELLNGLFLALERATRAGTSFVFGYLGGGDLPFAESWPGASFVLAFRALPLVLVVSALSALLFHWRILPWLVRGFSALLERSLGVGGALGVAAGANVFVGMVEAPLLVRPYLARLDRGELFAVMTCGMATIAGTVMVLYATLLSPVMANAAGHLLTASVISAPAALAVSALMVPWRGATAGSVADLPRAGSAMDAVTEGTLEGVKLLINIVAMLVVLVALVHLANQVLALLPDVAGSAISLQRVLGWAMAPVMWLTGVSWSEAAVAGSLMGTKTVLNELIAYLDLSRLPMEALSERSRLIVVYALCGFANFGSLGIMIGGLATMVPARRAEVVALGFRAIVSGTVATLMTGAAVGMLSP